MLVHIFNSIHIKFQNVVLSLGVVTFRFHKVKSQDFIFSSNVSGALPVLSLEVYAYSVGL